jgi:hypothetical protein
MKSKIVIFSIFIILIYTISCTKSTTEITENPITNMNKLEQEKAAILAVLNDETKAAFNRDYEGWKTKWIHESYVTKTYMDFSNNNMTETLGWIEIDDFVRTYIEEHPEPEPIPTLVDNIEVRLFDNAAWVSYEQNDAERGLKRETRLMEKQNGQWKIAGMHTTIYGFKK